MGVDGTLDMFRSSEAWLPPANMVVVMSLSPRERRVFRWIQARGLHGATRSEVSWGTDILDQSLGGVFGVLVATRLIFDTGDRRSTPSGRTARIFVAATE